MCTVQTHEMFMKISKHILCPQHKILVCYKCCAHDKMSQHGKHDHVSNVMLPECDLGGPLSPFGLQSWTPAVIMSLCAFECFRIALGTLSAKCLNSMCLVVSCLSNVRSPTQCMLVLTLTLQANQKILLCHCKTNQNLAALPQFSFR